MLQIFNKIDNEYFTEKLLKQVNMISEALFNDIVNYNYNSLANTFISPCMIDLLGLLRRLHKTIYSLQTLFLQNDNDYTSYRTGIYDILSYEFACNEILNFVTPMNILSVHTINRIQAFYETMHLFKDMNEKNEFEFRVNNKNNIDTITHD